jgi:NAD(P)-dependent dehydrogenase (short-subunit alcohol dehydrogenase family)
MTRANLSAEQVERIEADSLGGRLAVPEDVAETTKWLLSPLSRGVNAQFITVDAGWTVNRHV